VLAAGSFLDPLYKIVGLLLAVLYYPLHSLGLAIIVLTLIVMFVQLPLIAKQTRSMILMQRVQPEIKKIQQKYKDDRAKQNEELLKYYQENKINPLAGCLPLLLILPIGIAVLGTFRRPGIQYHIPRSGTFSKLYGMAGLRCGYCVAQPDKIELLRAQQAWECLSIMAIVAARASIDDNAQVENGRKNNSEVRKYVCGELDKMKFTYIPSHANFMMIDMRREVKPLIAAFKEKKVQVGRLFPPLPNFMRVTIGTRPQMERFVAAFKELTA